ncbi:hypothetical protein HGRIS_006211 [Hohenbuehelia grisea]|uniref:Vacuolar fusion protein MON1 n=1 Tax=Hohenbuehelia grisea TaxID=104357 RepID=A0ABR3JZ93_9AGAR
MTSTPGPRSRTSSRATAPALATRGSSSRLLIPSLRSTPSKSNLAAASYTSPATPTYAAATASQGLSHTVSQGSSNTTSPPLPPPPPATQPGMLDSSASSVANLDLSEGILVQDVDAEADTAESDEVTVMGSVETTAGEEDSKRSLRDQLRKTLNQKQPAGEVPSPRTRLKDKQAAMDELPYEAGPSFTPRQYFVLTDAGKPVFVSRSDEYDNDTLTSTIGIMQALISVFIDENDKLRCINTRSSRITFLVRSPLYYVCYSAWGEPESVTRSHLEYLHLQIISIVTASHLRRLFERRGNFDLRRMLDGAESFMTSILARLEFDLAISMSSLHCLKLDAGLRKRAGEALVPTSKIKDILYVFLVAAGKVVTLVRPKKHSIHPADIHIMLNTIHNPSILHSPASVSWIPVCLPKFNPSGFVNTYISYLRRDGDSPGPSGAASPVPSPTATPPPESDSSEEVPDAQVETTESGAGASAVAFPSTPKAAVPSSGAAEPDTGIALVCISGSAEFDAIRLWCDTVSQRLEKEGTLGEIVQALTAGKTAYAVGDLGIPGLRHFVYKSRGQVQVTMPVFEDPYDALDERRRLVTLYQLLHDAIHAKSGQEGMLKLQYLKTDKESVLGWITQPFELYIALSPRLPKSAAVGAANSVARWVKREEARLFLRDAPVF